MTVHQLTPTEARRIAVRAQLLDADRPEDLLDVIRHLTLLQADPTAAVAPNADLVLWSRLGRSYDRADLLDAVERCEVIDLRGMLRPAEDIALHRADMAAWPGGDDAPAWRLAQGRWVAANNAFRRDVLERLRRDGPLTTREIPDSADVPWRSTGWNNDRNVVMLLEMLVLNGEVSTAGRRGRDKLWDLASRIYPDDPVPDAADAARTRAQRRLRALGLARARTTECPVEPNDVGEVGEPAVIDGVPGQWRVDPDQLGRRFAGRTALLSPLDRLVYDRRRMVELFAFDYQLEMYKPKATRRWGYFALPVLHGDRLVGKVDATADRRAGVLRVDAIHRDEPFTAAMSKAVDRELVDLAAWLALDLLIVDG